MSAMLHAFEHRVAMLFEEIKASTILHTPASLGLGAHLQTQARTCVELGMQTGNHYKTLLV